MINWKGWNEAVLAYAKRVTGIPRKTSQGCRMSDQNSQWSSEIRTVYLQIQVRKAAAWTNLISRTEHILNSEGYKTQYTDHASCTALHISQSVYLFRTILWLSGHISLTALWWSRFRGGGRGGGKTGSTRCHFRAHKLFWAWAVLTSLGVQGKYLLIHVRYYVLWTSITFWEWLLIRAAEFWCHHWHWVPFGICKWNAQWSQTVNQEKKIFWWT
jgi:hypothetical protein